MTMFSLAALTLSLLGYDGTAIQAAPPTAQIQTVEKPFFQRRRPATQPSDAGDGSQPAYRVAQAPAANLPLPPPPPAARVTLPVPPPAAKPAEAKPETKADDKDNPAAEAKPALPLPPPPPAAPAGKPVAETKASKEPAPAAASLPLPPPPPGTAAKPATTNIPTPPPAGSNLPTPPAAGLPLPPPAGVPTPPPAGMPAPPPAGVPAPPPAGVPLPPPVGGTPAAAKSETPAAATAAKPAELSMPPVKGSHLADDKMFCMQCHGESDIWDAKNRRLFIDRKILGGDVHFQHGVSCVDCHGGNAGAQEIKDAPHAAEAGFRSKIADIRKFCIHCHADQAIPMRNSVHNKAGDKNDMGLAQMLECQKCHGVVNHATLPVRDLKSPVFLDHQVQTCGQCHAKELDSYMASVHGKGLSKLGLLVTAACADCHGAHGIYRPLDNQSTLHATKVAATCGKCHRFIEERLASSVHGRGAGPGGQADREAPGGKLRQKPSCTDCHQRHEISDPEQGSFRLRMPSVCGNCHGKLSSRYLMSMHGQLTRLGYEPGAKCSDCHGSHEIFALDDPRSLLSPDKRAGTCGKCHPGAAGNFLKFDPHLDPDETPIVRGAYLFFLTILLSVMGFFGLHSLLWFIRQLVDVIKHGRPARPQPGEIAFMRFPAEHRIGHAFTLMAFLGLAATGLPLKYSHMAWAQQLAKGLGGFESTHFWHRACALVLFGCLFGFMFQLVLKFLAGRRQGKTLWQLLFSPDSLVPNLHDVGDFFRMLRWFFGLGPKPGFERWTYWEKVDFWGATADTVIIGITGLILWFPNFFCMFLPAVSLNVAKVIHSTQALLATAFVFAIHFFNTHFRPDRFPADMSILSGLVSEHEMQEERPQYYERLKREGRLEHYQAKVPSRTQLWLVMLLGFVALAIGLALLLGIILAGFEG